MTQNRQRVLLIGAASVAVVGVLILALFQELSTGIFLRARVSPLPGEPAPVAFWGGAQPVGQQEEWPMTVSVRSILAVPSGEGNREYVFYTARVVLTGFPPNTRFTIRELAWTKINPRLDHDHVKQPWEWPFGHDAGEFSITTDENGRAEFRALRVPRIDPKWKGQQERVEVSYRVGVFDAGRYVRGGFGDVWIMILPQPVPLPPQPAPRQSVSLPPELPEPAPPEPAPLQPVFLPPALPQP